MNFAAAELLQTYWAIPVGAVFFLAPGYLLAQATNFFRFRTRSGREQMLWSVALSAPLSIVLAPLLRRHLPLHWTLTCFCLLAVVAVVLTIRTSRIRIAGERTAYGRTFKIVLWLCAGLAIILPLETNDLQVGHRIFQSTVVYDWSVRVPLVRAAMESGVPPANPLSALNGGHAPPLRYYYFWYVLVAQLAHLAHVDARAALAASTVWAAFTFLAVLFLCLKYFAGLRERLETQCLLAMLVGCVMGLDLLFAVAMLLLPVGIPIEMEWWHPDRSPSWLSTFLYAPHHIACIACCMLGFLAVVACRGSDEAESDASSVLPRNHWLTSSLIAGVCFAAAGGASTFVALIFAVICTLWAVRSAFKRKWMTIAVLALAAVFAYAFTRSFLHEMGGGEPTGHGIAHFAFRNNDFISQTFAKHHLVEKHKLLSFALRPLALLLLPAIEFGFFTLVFVHRLRRDFFAQRTLSRYEQALWTVFSGAGLCAFFVSSADGGPNDLGMHAGMVMKFVLLVWATPWVADAWQQRSLLRLSPRKKLVAIFAAGAFAIGLGGSLYQAAMERTLFALPELGLLHKKMDIYPVRRLSYRLYDVRDAYVQTAALQPPDGSLLFNPGSPLQPAFSLYATQQIAAADRKCGTAFGGSLQRCVQVMPQLRMLFGNSPDGVDEDAAAPTVASTSDLDAVCRELSLGAVLVSASDAIWSQPSSWVWQRQPLFANGSVRVIACNSHDGTGHLAS